MKNAVSLLFLLSAASACAADLAVSPVPVAAGVAFEAVVPRKVAADAAAPRVSAGPALVGWLADGKTAFVVGDTVGFRFHVSEPGEVTLHRFGDDRVDEFHKIAADAEGDIALDVVASKPGVVSVEAKTPKGALTLAAVVAFDGIRGKVARPDDFDAFWAEMRKTAAAGLDRAELKPMGKGFAVTMPCGAAMPMTGGFSVPADAGKGSCTAVMSFPGYNATASAGVPPPLKGKIMFDFNPHGTPLGMPGAFYEEFAKTNGIANYGFEADRNLSRETTYFHDMALRLLAAVAFVKSRPEWNGRIEVNGGSQGGFLSLLAAALEPSVKKVDALYPWMCDLDSDVSGYYGGWHPHYTPALAYYFPLNHAASVRAEKVNLTIGLADTTCTPYGIIALYNELAVPKSVKVYQAAWHCGPSRNAKLDFSRER